MIPAMPPLASCRSWGSWVPYCSSNVRCTRSLMASPVGLYARVSLRALHEVSLQAWPRAQATERPETWEVSMMFPEFHRRHCLN